MFRFTIRDVLWLTVVVAVGMGWLVDHRRIDSAPKLSVEIISSRDVKFSTLDVVVSAVRDNLGDNATVVLGIQATGAVSAKISVSSDTPYRRLTALIDAIRAAGVGNITLAEPPAK